MSPAHKESRASYAPKSSRESQLARSRLEKHSFNPSFASFFRPQESLRSNLLPHPRMSTIISLLIIPLSSRMLCLRNIVSIIKFQVRALTCFQDISYTSFFSPICINQHLPHCCSKRHNSARAKHVESE